MEFNFDITAYDSQCFMSDSEWAMVLESGAFVKTGKVYHTVFKRKVLTFKITNVGNVELLRIRNIPCARYKLPMLDNILSFNQRAAAILECDRLSRGRELDDELFNIYGKNCG